MSSILTNTSAMVALQTLKGINSSLAQTQNEISTGKAVYARKRRRKMRRACELGDRICRISNGLERALRWWAC